MQGLNTQLKIELESEDEVEKCVLNRDTEQTDKETDLNNETEDALFIGIDKKKTNVSFSH